MREKKNARLRERMNDEFICQIRPATYFRQWSIEKESDRDIKQKTYLLLFKLVFVWKKTPIMMSFFSLWMNKQICCFLIVNKLSISILFIRLLHWRKLLWFSDCLSKEYKHEMYSFLNQQPVASIEIPLESDFKYSLEFHL